MTNKIIMVGMNPRTRSAIPWDADAEFWTLNEGHAKPWMKKFDVLFQIHPRWDWERTNNIAFPNHPLFIKGVDGDCLFCKGSGKAFSEGSEVPCPWCEGGIYKVGENRYSANGKPKRIVMQDANEDVAGCVRFSAEKITVALCGDGKPYFTSTLAHMLAFAIYRNLNDRKREKKESVIELYGFESESGTEYAAQRPCIEYWIAYGRGRGMSIEAPGSGLVTGRHYAYEDMDQGYRSRLEMRKQVLHENLNKVEVEAVKSEGYLDALTPFKNIKRVRPFWEQAFDDHFRKKNMVSFLRGTIKELDNAIAILDGYRLDSDEAKQTDVRRLISLQYELG